MFRKFEDRSEEETLKQERCARRDAWKMSKSILKLKEKDRATFYSPSEVWSDREFVVDSGASLHMLSRKDQNSAELDTVRVSQNPTTVATANGEVQNEEATVCVCDLDLFVIVHIL